MEKRGRGLCQGTARDRPSVHLAPPKNSETFRPDPLGCSLSISGNNLRSQLCL
jgi:hypothetical protein